MDANKTTLSETIDNYVNWLFSEFEIHSPPVDIKQICANLKIDIIVEDLTQISATARREISGVLFVDESKGINAILINRSDSPRRQRFTIAHELGHYFLHRNEDEPKPVIISFRGDRCPMEYEADNFAAELLMPRKMLFNKYKQLLLPYAYLLANEFDVSTLAMKYRMDTLGLKYYD